MIARRAALGLIGAAVTAPALAAPLTYHLRAEPVADGLWVVRGADDYIRAANGGAVANITIARTDAGAVLIDCGPSLRYGQALAALARQLTGAPVARVYITHLHPDHNYGALAFPAAAIAATPAEIDDLRRNGPGFSDGMYRLLGDWMRGTEFRLPAVQLTGDGETIGGRRFRFLKLSGHSAADLAVLDEATGTLIAGDLVFHNRAPTTPNADLAAWHASLGQLRALGHARVVPGHGPVDPGPFAAINQTGDWLTWIAGALADAAAGGLDMVEAGQIAIPPRFAAMAAARYEVQRTVSHLYPALDAGVLPRLDRR